MLECAGDAAADAVMAAYAAARVCAFRIGRTRADTKAVVRDAEGKVVLDADVRDLVCGWLAAASGSLGSHDEIILLWLSACIIGLSLTLFAISNLILVLLPSLPHWSLLCHPLSSLSSCPLTRPLVSVSFTPSPSTRHTHTHARTLAARRVGGDLVRDSARGGQKHGVRGHRARRHARAPLPAVPLRVPPVCCRSVGGCCFICRCCDWHCCCCCGCGCGCDKYSVLSNFYADFFFIRLSALPCPDNSPISHLSPLDCRVSFWPLPPVC